MALVPRRPRLGWVALPLLALLLAGCTDADDAEPEPLVPSDDDGMDDGSADDGDDGNMTSPGSGNATAPGNQTGNNTTAPEPGTNSTAPGNDTDGNVTVPPEPFSVRLEHDHMSGDASVPFTVPDNPAAALVDVHWVPSGAPVCWSAGASITLTAPDGSEYMAVPRGIFDVAVPATEPQGRCASQAEPVVDEALMPGEWTATFSGTGVMTGVVEITAPAPAEEPADGGA